MNRALLSALVLAPTLAAGQANVEKSMREIDSAGKSLVSAKCPAPLAATEEQVKNRHVDGVIDQIRSVRCEGFWLKYYVAHFFDPPRELPMHLVLARPYHGLPVDLNVGASEAQVRSRLGSPESVKDGRLIYVSEEESGSDTVTFAVRGGKVVEIEWTWDID